MELDNTEYGPAMISFLADRTKKAYRGVNTDQQNDK